MSPVAFCWLMVATPPCLSEEDEYIVPFQDQTTPVCELIGLRATPPDGWFAVAMQDLPDGMAGCQLVRTDEDEALVGIIRMSASDTGGRPPGEDSRNRQVVIELEVLAAMGIQPRELIWRRDDVPLTGDKSAGFSSAQAVGLSATIDESGLDQELHFLTFHGPTTQYVLVLVTPPPETEPDIHRRNLSDFGGLIRGLEAAPMQR